MKLKKELPLIGIVLLPFIYLAYIWSELPAKVPMHWNYKGEIDRYGDRIEIIMIPILLPLLIYITFLIIPIIGPKKNLTKMRNKLQSLKTLLTILMSILALYIIYSIKNKSLSNPNYIVLLIGALYIIFGNYFKTIKANYFIGIRTPWTLENDNVWKKTHKLGGILWFIGGIIVVLSSLISDKATNFRIFLGVTILITVIPIIYSYVIFNKEKQIEQGA
ncbi:SdpI family protein [Joostella atrarenae]|uniref:SdpI family protein n=1 Tax=Joostella atrarenae TaxID=679257 RepID=A0ABS9J1X7_9FLAO|nr:SdpI family protein [Joostella atrarenae]MCF8714358.1 SdpI family protein [Joostella atrarenae]